MKKAAWDIPASAWQGLNSRYSPDSNLFGADEFSTGSVNFSTDETGDAVKRDGTTKYNASVLTAAPRDQFEMVFNSGVRHMLEISGTILSYTTGDGTFATGKIGLSSTANTEFASYQDRAYAGNGVDDNFSYDLTTSYGGVTYTAPQTKKMGALAPSSAPTAGNPSSGGSIPDGAHTYKVTFLYYGYEESNGSTASGVKTCSTGNNTIALSAIPVGGYGVTARKVYRDNNDSVYVLIGTIADNSTTTLSDTVVLGTTSLPTDNNVPPKWSYAVTHRDRIWVAGVSSALSTLYYSEAGFPDIFFTNNYITCSQRDPITALSVYNDRVVVYNKASFGILQGTTSRDFRYIEISPNVGCIDNRSIQVITVKGVPKVQWLGALGVYQWDGANLQLVSVKINNLLKFNIQQAASTRSQLSQTTQADFEAGTKTTGITLTGNPGNITTAGYAATMNPTKEWDTETEWEGGSSLTNVATKLDNKMTVPTRHTPSLSDGTHNNTVIIDSKLKLPVTTAFDGESYLNANIGITPSQNSYYIQQSFQPTRSGVLNSVQFFGGWNGAITTRVYTDSNGQPGSVLYEYTGTPTTGYNRYTVATNIAVTAGTKYWMGYSAGNLGYAPQGHTALKFSGSQECRTSANGSSPWGTGQGITTLASAYACTSDLIAQSGTWLGPSYDSLSTTTQAASVTLSGSDYPTGTSIVVSVEAAEDDIFTTGVTRESLGSFTGTSSATLSGKRYWRLKFVLSTTNDTVTPYLHTPFMKFNTTGTWISDVIDHTTDITTLDALVLTSTAPAGTTAAVTIATSANNSSYSSYTAVGSATPARYSKVKVVLTSDSDNITTATATSVRLDWSLSSTFTSSAISTVTIPAGWAYFQATDETNGGTITYSTRSATSSGGLASASYAVAANGVTIPSAVNIWIQYKAVLVAHANQVPLVSSVAINWLTSLKQGIRVASMFYDKSYYLAAAEFSQTTNNIVMRYDENGNWSQWTGLGINTMGLFFGSPYFGSSTTGYFYKWLDPTVTTDDGTNIALDLRTAAYIAGDLGSTQLLTNLVVQAVGTGARFYPYYSVDGGTTWLNMSESVTGLTYYVTPDDGMTKTLMFRPLSDSVTWGYNTMIRVYSSDAYPVTISGLRATATISDRPVQLRS